MTWLPLALLALVTACREPAPGTVEPVDYSITPDDGPATLLWATEVHRRDFGWGIDVQPLTREDGREVVAVLHDGDSANVLFHVDTADGRIVDSFIVDAPGFGMGTLHDRTRGPRRLGNDYVANIDDWPFRVSLRDGVVRWLQRRNLKSGYVAEDEGALYTANFVDYGDHPRLIKFDLATGTVVDSFVLEDYLGHYPRRRRGGFGKITAVDVRPGGDDGAASGPVVVATNSYITLDTPGIYRSWLQGIRWSDKKVLWRRRLTDNISMISTPQYVHDGRVIIAPRDTIMSLDPATGEVYWKYTPWNEAVDGVPLGRRYFDAARGLVADDGLAYFGAGDSYVACIEIATGREVWRHEPMRGQGSGRGFQLTEDGLLIRTSGSWKRIFVHDRYTGEQLAVLDKVTNGGNIFHGVHYDAGTRRVYGYDGARVFCYRLNFEPPGGG